MTPDEARLATHRMRAWSGAERQVFLRLPDREKLLVGEAAALLDIAPYSHDPADDEVLIDLRSPHRPTDA